MKSALLMFVLLLVSAPGVAGQSLYEDLAGNRLITDGYVVKKTEYGLDLDSVATYRDVKGKTEPLTTIVLEGPFEQFKSLDQGFLYASNMVKPEVDAGNSASPAEHAVYPGLGASYVNVNGTVVAILDYKMNRVPDTYVMRTLIESRKGMYSFAITMHKSHPKDRRMLRLMAIVVASVNSGKL